MATQGIGWLSHTECAAILNSSFSIFTPSVTQEGEENSFGMGFYMLAIDCIKFSQSNTRETLGRWGKSLYLGLLRNFRQCPKYLFLFLSFAQEKYRC